jgi:hypothetical protein
MVKDLLRIEGLTVVGVVDRKENPVVFVARDVRGKHQTSPL